MFLPASPYPRRRQGTGSERVGEKKKIASDVMCFPFFSGLCFWFAFVVFLEPRAQVKVRNMRRWCIGNIEASQALAPGSTPGRRICFLFSFEKNRKKESVFEGRIELPTFCV